MKAKLIASCLLKPINTRHVDVLDGVRALAVLIVAWFHIWQQSWLGPYFDVAGHHIDLFWLVSTGYVFVDALILLSGFCLFLPYARHMLENEACPTTGEFYLKRAARILPSYWLCLAVVLFGFALPNDEYGGSSRAMWLDVLSHLSFTQTLWPETYMGTRLNVVLWTLAVEVQFYLIFPIVAWTFVRQPLASYLALVFAAQWFRFAVVHPGTDISMTFNQLPNFLDVYANGMLAALAFVKLTTTYRESRFQVLISTAATVLTLASGYCLTVLMKDLSTAGDHQHINAWQSGNRFVLSLTFVAFMLSAAFSLRPFRWLLSNRAMVFVSVISYNFFIWHQYLAVRLKLWQIPPSLSPTPHMAGEHAWQVTYTLYAFTLASLVAILVTYGFERPLAERFRFRLRSTRPASFPPAQPAAGPYSESG